MKGVLSLFALATVVSGAVLPRDAKSSTPTSVAASNSTASSQVAAASSSSSSSSAAGGYFMDDIYKNAADGAKGRAPFVDNPDSYSTYKNAVRDYKAPSDGNGDASDALQQAIDDGDRSGTSKSPRTIFLPSGTYSLSKTLNLKMGTFLIGDPSKPPTIKAGDGFSDDTLINGYDSDAGHAETSFLVTIKNINIDTSGASGSLTALQWGVAQGCHTTNVAINMPDNSKHTGIDLKGGSTIAVADVNITGGSVGISNSNQQVNFKNIAFNKCKTGYKATGGWVALLQSPTFSGNDVGVDLASGNTANIAIVDATASDIGTALINFKDSSNTGGKRNNQIYLQNLAYSGSSPIAKTTDGKSALDAAQKVDAWAWGNVSPGNYQAGTTNLTAGSSSALLVNGKFATPAQPTLAGLAAADVVNVKAVDGHKVNGDGKNNDADSLNAILADAAKANKAVFFPFGVYIVESTLKVPAGSRLIGEGWSVISGSGDAFNDAKNPAPVVQIGNAGETGTAQLQDLRFTVAGVSPGAIIVQINLAGNAPGDVGLWNCPITIGGTADSAVTTKCSDQDTKNCMAAFLGLHLTNSSSAYVENTWVWTADHALDGVGGNQIISTHGGVLVESTKATWLMGLGSEHHWLYNVNIHNAGNVYAGLIQTETPYMQGADAVQTAPAPWTADARFGDPDYSWCAPDDQKCRTALAVNVAGGHDVFLFGGANWAFFNGPWDGKYDHACQGSCQTNMNKVDGVQHMVFAQIGTKSADTLVLDGKGDPSEANHPGGWGGVIAAYETFNS